MIIIVEGADYEVNQKLCNKLSNIYDIPSYEVSVDLEQKFSAIMSGAVSNMIFNGFHLLKMGNIKGHVEAANIDKALKELGAVLVLVRTTEDGSAVLEDSALKYSYEQSNMIKVECNKDTFSTIYPVVGNYITEEIVARREKVIYE